MAARRSRGPGPSRSRAQPKKIGAGRERGAGSRVVCLDGDCPPAPHPQCRRLEAPHSPERGAFSCSDGAMFAILHCAAVKSRLTATCLPRRIVRR